MKDSEYVLKKDYESPNFGTSKIPKGTRLSIIETKGAIFVYELRFGGISESFVKEAVENNPTWFEKV